MPERHFSNLDYDNVADNDGITIEKLRKEIEDIVQKNQSLKNQIAEAGRATITPFSQEDFLNVKKGLDQFNSDVGELTELTDEIFSVYGRYVNESMKQIEGHAGELSEAIQIMASNQDRYDEIKKEIISRSSRDEADVDLFFQNINREFNQQIERSLFLQQEEFTRRTEEWLSGMFQVQEKEQSDFFKFQVQALLKIMIVNLSTQITVENIALVVKEKLETLDNMRILLTQELMFIKNSLTTFKNLFYTYKYV